MACLSVQLEGKNIFVVCANPIFPISDMRDGALTFEVFEDDAASLKLRLGKKELYVLDGGKPWFGELISLEPCRSTHPGLSLLRHKPTMRGTMKIYDYIELQQPADLTN
jgi:hypothetical protein